MNDHRLNRLASMKFSSSRAKEPVARHCSAQVCLPWILLASTDADAQGGSGGALGFEILFGLAVLIAIGWLVAQVKRETKKMIFDYVIAAAVLLTVLQFVFNVLS